MMTLSLSHDAQQPVESLEGETEFERLAQESIIDTLSRLDEEQETQGVETFALETLLKTAAVIGAHTRLHGRRQFEGLDEQILRRFGTTFSEVLPVLLALSESGCISVSRTERDAWVFCLFPPQ